MNIASKTKSKMSDLKKRYANGCTGVPNFNFKSCCDEHDVGYSLKEHWRIYYDWQLFKCVNKTRKNPIIASGYFVGVRALGFYWWWKAKK